MKHRKLWKGIASLAMLLCLANSNVAIADDVPAMHFGADWRPMDTLTCSYKAMDALIAQNFIEARRTRDSAWGFNEQSWVLVRCITQNQGAYIEVLAASRSSQEAERLRNEIRTKVFDASRPKAPAPDFFHGEPIGPTPPPPRVRNYPPLHWGFDTRPKSLQGCVSAAKLAMRTYGLQSTPSGDSVVWGQSSTVTVLVACTPISQGVSILVAATSNDGPTAERFRNDIRKLIFDSVSFD